MGDLSGIDLFEINDFGVLVIDSLVLLFIEDVDLLWMTVLFDEKLDESRLFLLWFTVNFY